MISIEILHFCRGCQIDRFLGSFRQPSRPDHAETNMAQTRRHSDITQAVIDRMADCQDPRFKQVMTSLVRHLHAFAREVDLKPDEWMTAIEFLTASARPATTSGRSSSCCRTRWACRCWWWRWSRRARGAAGPHAAPRRRPKPRCRARSTGKARPSCRWAATSREGMPGEPALLQRPRDRPRRPADRRTRCSTSGRATAKACTTCSWARTPACARAPLPHRRRGPLLVLVDQARPSTRCPTTARWATCCARWAGTRTARATST